MLNYTLKELAAELAAKRASSVEVTQFFLNRINGLGKTLNAFISVDDERSLAGAWRELSRPLFPVLPYSIDKATNTTLADLVDGNLGEGGEPALAFSNPLYVDVDGGGFTAPGVRITP